METLSRKVHSSINHAPVAAGTTDVTDCEVIDMQGYEGVRFLVGFGTITSSAVTSLKVQQAEAKSSATALTSGADLAGSSVAVADTDSNKMFIVEVVRPAERYLQLSIDRGTANAVVDFVLAEKYGARKLPITQDSDVDTLEVHVSPTEGTA